MQLVICVNHDATSLQLHVNCDTQESRSSKASYVKISYVNVVQSHMKYFLMQCTTQSQKQFVNFQCIVCFCCDYVGLRFYFYFLCLQWLFICRQQMDLQCANHKYLSTWIIFCLSLQVAVVIVVITYFVMVLLQCVHLWCSVFNLSVTTH